jgi:prevent-host-death family protein
MAIFAAIGTHSVAEAKNRLSDLIDRALAGEAVTITRHGRPVVELRPVQPEPGPVQPEDLDWLAARLVGDAPARLDAGRLVSEMRDEDEER